ncbi:MAG: MBL fold metallo-hydrolase [Desulfobacterales bacterium]|nr:MBL fold metallo-hydrolase [Desulfobacterales bacterium]
MTEKENSMPIEILENLFFIERGWLNANHFVLRGEAPVLIDTAYIRDFDETERLITGLGVNPSHVKLIISTHSHCDHIGGNRRIQEMSGCDIAMHEVGKHFMDVRDDWSTWWKYYNQKADFFHCTRTLEDGETVNVGPHEFQVIYTPGHASDGVVLYHRKEKALLSSDALWENDIPVMTPRVEGSRALFVARESLEKLASLDVRVVYPGHGKPFTDMKTAIAGSAKKIEKLLESRDGVGTELLKKIIVYTVLMHNAVPEKRFFSHLMDTHWFKETAALYFNGEYLAKYNEITGDFLKRGVLKREGGQLYTTVKP